jgi:hypothetical protein
MPKRICRKTKTKEWSRSKIKLSVLLWTQCFYKWKPKLKPKPKQKLHVETTAVADAAAVILLHQFQLSNYHLQFQFQFLPRQDVQLDKIELMDHVYGTLFLYQWVIQIPAHQGSILTETEAVFHLHSHQPLLIHQFQWPYAPQDITVMDKEGAMLQSQFHLQLAQLGTSLTEKEFVLQFMNQFFAYLDILMDQEVAFQSLLKIN